MAPRAALSAMTKAQKKNAAPRRPVDCPPPPDKKAPAFEPFVIDFHQLAPGYNPEQSRNGQSWRGLPGADRFIKRHTDVFLPPIYVHGTTKTNAWFIAVAKYNKNGEKHKRSPPMVLVQHGKQWDPNWNNGILRRDRLKREREERVERARASRKQMKK